MAKEQSFFIAARTTLLFHPTLPMFVFLLHDNQKLAKLQHRGHNGYIMAKLYVMATPIGNLQDITLRALEVLNAVDVIVAEDTRVTKKLLAHFSISKPILSYHGHSSFSAQRRIIAYLHDGKNVALLTDAGTPGISDPGQRLIRAAVEAGFSTGIVSIPGPSALTAIISVSDIDCGQFSFFGFPPRKKGRTKFFHQAARESIPIILFESPHRIHRTLEAIFCLMGDRYCNIGRELTKIYEEVFRGTICEAKKYFERSKPRGEFVIIIAPKT